MATRDGDSKSRSEDFVEQPPFDMEVSFDAQFSGTLFLFLLAAPLKKVFPKRVALFSPGSLNN